MASEKHQFIASRLVKEVASLGGDVAPFVSPMVAARLKARFAGRSANRALRQPRRRRAKQ
jgi:pantetheine-phosphate adenylyltransferase